MAVEDSNKKLAGWPFENYAVNLRRWNTGNSGAVNTTGRVAIATPRHKHTFFAEFILGPGVTHMVTNVASYLEDTSLYVHLKSIDLPKPNLATYNLRSYNRNYKIQKKLEFEPLTMRFHDDSTSMVMSLVKDMLNFVNHSGELGGNLRQQQATSAYIAEYNKFSHNLTGVSALAGTGTSQPRSDMDKRPSLGMRLRECGRMFLESITIYDMGTEPDSINIYTYMNPHLVSVDPEGRDQTESGVAEVQMTFEYENYMFTVGQPKNAVKAVIDRMLGISGSPAYATAEGHAKMDDLDLGVDPACQADCNQAGSAVIGRNPGEGTDLVRSVLGDFVGTDNTNTVKLGPDGQPVTTQAIDPRTGQPYTALDFGNNADAALNYYQDQLERARTSYAQVAGRGIISPEVEQYRRQQIDVLQQQVDAINQFRNGLSSGNALPFGLDTNSATINSARILIGGVASLVGISPSDSQQIQNLAAQELINTKRTALEAQANAEDIAQQAALSKQSLALNVSQNRQYADEAEFHRQQAVLLRRQADALFAPPQFPTYIPEYYGSGGTNAGGTIAAITKAIALQAIGSFLAAGGIV